MNLETKITYHHPSKPLGMRGTCSKCGRKVELGQRLHKHSLEFTRPDGKQQQIGESWWSCGDVQCLETTKQRKVAGRLKYLKEKLEHHESRAKHYKETLESLGFHEKMMREYQEKMNAISARKDNR